MIKTVEYFTEQERVNALEQNSHLFWIEEKNIIEGNFLVFSDTPLEPPEPPKIYINIPEEQFNSLKQRQDATDNMVLQLIMEGGVV